MFLIIQQGAVLFERYTIEQAIKIVHEMESEDKEAGFYETNRYKIVEVEQ